MRKLIRSIAKARLKCMGVGNINKKIAKRKDNVPLWRAVTEGESGRKAEQVQINYGLMMKAKKEGTAVRKIRKVTV